MKDMLLSGYSRHNDLSPMRLLCRGKSVLDLGANIGLLAYEALSNGATSVDLVEFSQENHDVISHILAPSSSNSVTAYKADLTKKSLQSILPHLSFDTVFFLATYQHLEKQNAGSGSQILREIVESINPEYLVFRSKGYSDIAKDFILSSGMRLLYTSNLNEELAPLFIFKRD